MVVVEAELRSGSLITARLAAEQGRKVLAVPGSPLDPRAKGTNDLIRQGAALWDSAKDVLRAIAGRLDLRDPGGAPYDPAPLEEADQALIERVAPCSDPRPRPATT